jgi:hypothetical protein
MPTCIKNKTKSYKGNEPSPKGLGYCAHCEKVGTIKKGYDDNKWIVVKVKNAKRWIRYNKKNNKKNNKNINCSKFVIYEKRAIIRKFIVRSERLIGIQDKKGYIRKFISYNKFEKKYTKIPKGYKKRKINKDIINEYCGTKTILTQNNETYKKIKKEYKGYKTYFIHQNGGRPYLVYIKNKNVIIYEIPNDVSIDDKLFNRNDNKNKWMYIKLIKKYKANTIFIGKSPKIKMTEYSGGYGKAFDGNSILLMLKPKKYVFIGETINEFTINDKIEKYYSLVGNNDVPYPMAFSKTNVYFFVYPVGYLPRTEFPAFRGNKDLQKIFDKGCELDPFLISFMYKKSDAPRLSLEEFKKIKDQPLKDIPLEKIKCLAKMYSVVDSGSKQEIADTIENLRGVVVYKKINQ